MANKPNPAQVSANAHDIGYVLGKMEMMEKKFDEHRLENKGEMELVLDKLDKMSQTMSFWRHTLWLVKALGLSIPLVLTANHGALLELWNDL
jgi:hypothetical protein